MIDVQGPGTQEYSCSKIFLRPSLLVPFHSLLSLFLPLLSFPLYCPFVPLLGSPLFLSVHAAMKSGGFVRGSVPHTIWTICIPYIQLYPPYTIQMQDLFWQEQTPADILDQIFWRGLIPQNAPVDRDLYNPFWGERPLLKLVHPRVKIPSLSISASLAPGPVQQLGMHACQKFYTIVTIRI